MRRRGGGWLYLAVLPFMVLAQSGYDAQPIGQSRIPPPVPRGYQPPPSSMLFEVPRSRYNYQNQHYQQPDGNGYDDYRIVPHNAAQLEVHKPGTQPGEVEPSSISVFRRPSGPHNQLRHQSTDYAIAQPNNEPLNQPGYPRPQATAPHRLIYTPQIVTRPQAGAPAIQPPGLYRATEENPPDVVNNIIVHIYLNAKERKSHTVVTAGPVRGIFGIGTSHGGPGTHTNPVVITKDFDRDTLEFIEEKRADEKVEEGPANIVEVKATVSTPDRKIESTLNKAVNTELDRAIPVILNRMQGPMGALDNELRKELEQALVDEIAKNLGDTIDQIGATVDDEDLGKLIEEGFNEIDKEFSTTRSSTTAAPATTAEPSPPTRSSTTLRTTTTSWPIKATTTILVDEMMEESPFEEAPREVRPEPATSITPLPKTFRASSTTASSIRTTTTTSPSSIGRTSPPTTRRTTPASTTGTTPWWMSTTPSTVGTTRPTATETRPTTTTRRESATPAVFGTARPTTAMWTVPWWMTTPSTVSTTRSSTTGGTSISSRPTSTAPRPTTAMWTVPWWMTTPSTVSTTRSTTTRGTSTSRPTTTAPLTTTMAGATSRPTPTAAPSAAPFTTTTTLGNPSAQPTGTTKGTLAPTRSAVHITTTSAPNRWRTTDVTFTTSQATTVTATEQTTELSTASSSVMVTTTKPSTFAGDNLMHRKPQFEETREELPTRWQGQIQPPVNNEEEQEPKIVTSRPIHIVSLDESSESVNTTLGGTTMGVRITTPSSVATTEAPHTAIFDEFAFDTVTAAPSTVPAPSSIGTPASTHFTTGAPSPTTQSTTVAAATEFPPMPEESEEVEYDEEEGRTVTKGRPSSFGGENIFRTKTKPAVLEEEATPPEEQAAESATARPLEVGLSATTAAIIAVTASAASSTTRSPFASTERVTAATARETAAPAPTASVGSAKTPSPASSGEAETTSSGTSGITTPGAFLASSPTSSSVSSPEMGTTLSATTGTASSSAMPERPPFEGIPGMFEESDRPTVAHREPTTVGTIAQQMTTTAPKAEEVQPLPDSFSIPKGSCPTPNDPSDQNRTDVLFLLDSSNSFNELKFMHAIQLILDTVAEFRNIGPNGTQVSLVQYNSEPYLEFSLRKHNCKQWLSEDIADTDYMQGGSMLGKAVEKVSRFAFTKNRGDRPDAENVLVILTDGRSDDRIQEPVEIAKKNNLTVLVIATLEANPKYLMELAGSMDNVFQLHVDLKNSLPHKLAQRINSIATEQSTPDTFRVRDGHEMFTIALPTEDNNERQGLEGREEEVPAATESSFLSFPAVPTPSSESTGADGMVHLHCSPLGFKITFNVPTGYEGVAVVKGQESDRMCRKDIRASETSAGSIVGFFVATKSCGVVRVDSVEPAGHNYTMILHMKHHNALVTGGDRAYLLQCFIGKPLEDQELTADLGVMKGELMIAETISLSSVPPTCAYSIRKDAPNGTIVTNAFVGQTVYHRWECDGGQEANNVYGIQVHSCYASDDVDKKFPIVDSRGCSSDLTLLADPEYLDDRLTAYAESKVFAFREGDQLKFLCKLSLCTRDGDGCEGVTPPVCGGNSPELLVTRRIRHQNSAMEGALSSALSTKVDVSSNSPPSTQDRVVGFIASKLSWVLLAAFVVLAVSGTVILSRHAAASTDSSTTCSDPDIFLSPPISPMPPLFASPFPRTSPHPLMDTPATTHVPTAVVSQPLARAQVSLDERPVQEDFERLATEHQHPADSEAQERSRRLTAFMADFDRSKYV